MILHKYTEPEGTCYAGCRGFVELHKSDLRGAFLTRGRGSFFFNAEIDSISKSGRKLCKWESRLLYFMANWDTEQHCIHDDSWAEVPQ